MKLVGGDSGRYEHETFVDEVLLAPSERAIVDVLFDRPGDVPLEHRTPDHTYLLGTVTVGTTRRSASSSPPVRARCRTAAEITAERARIDADGTARPTRPWPSSR